MTLEATELLPTAELEAYLDAKGLGSGTPRAARIGDGASNLTYLVEREGARVVLRRPPPPPLPPSAHDMVREANIQICLRRGGVRVPEILAVCEDDAVIGAPFYVMEEIVGAVITDAVPPALDTPEERRRLGFELVDGLVDLHAVDYDAVRARPASASRPATSSASCAAGRGLWEVNATRELADCLEIGELLKASMPESPPSTVVHGDYRLGNVMVGLDAPARLVGDPRLGDGDDRRPARRPRLPLRELDRAGRRRAPAAARARHRPPTGFPSRDELVARYAERTGRDVSRLRWYEAFALWKASVFCEAIYGRYVRGERDDPWAGALCDGVPRLLEVARSYLLPCTA